MDKAKREYDRPSTEFPRRPWHVGFHNQIADRLRPTGEYNPDMVRYSVVQVCDFDGRHVCWAKSEEHARLIVEAVNSLGSCAHANGTL